MFLKIFKKPRSRTDAESIALYRQSGDLGVLGELYERYMELVFGVCYNYLRNEEEAKDAVMQVFEQLIDDLKNHEVTNFKSWLHSVARNYCLMLHRAKKMTFVGDETLLASEKWESWSATSDDSTLELDQQLSALGDCMKTLTAEQKASVELFYLQQKCYKEIAEQTGFEINKVKSYLQNGKRNLKLCMEGQRHE